MSAAEKPATGRLAGRAAIVTGAAGGLGAAQARRFVAEGCHVVLTDLTEERGRSLADKLGEAATFVAHDIADEKAWERVVATAVEGFGGLDVLVNNAAFYAPAPLAETSVDDYRRHVEVNQIGTFIGIKAAAAAMAPERGGAIVNIASTVALRGYPNMFAYQATKWAIRGMTHAAAVELAPRRIRVNAVMPGLIDTPMIASNLPGMTERLVGEIPLGRIGEAEDVAAAVLYLASPESAFVTGQEIVVDGGKNA